MNNSYDSEVKTGKQRMIEAASFLLAHYSHGLVVDIDEYVCDDMSVHCITVCVCVGTVITVCDIIAIVGTRYGALFSTYGMCVLSVVRHVCRTVVKGH
jgi:hypothetical protein